MSHRNSAAATHSTSASPSPPSTVPTTTTTTSTLIHLEILLSESCRHFIESCNEAATAASGRISSSQQQYLREKTQFTRQLLLYLQQYFPVIPAGEIAWGEQQEASTRDFQQQQQQQQNSPNSTPHQLFSHIQKITTSNSTPVKMSQCQFKVYLYCLSDEEAYEEYTGSDAANDQVEACRQYLLPSREFQDLWESLIFDANDSLKRQLLRYVETTMLFSECGINNKIIGWNRVCLFHGEPGTGKTTLCQALAQKLSIRMQHRYPHGGQLIEINAHSLFSKYFSESGKLVMKLFARIREMIEDEDAFVCVLIDEVESLTAARKSALSGNEPSDSIRVVNAVLTQIDNLRQHKNVLIVCTSNITEAIDVAFVDRADIKQYIGLPSVYARYMILKSCIDELQRCRIVAPRQEIPSHNAYGTANVVSQAQSNEDTSNGSIHTTGDDENNMMETENDEAPTTISQNASPKEIHRHLMHVAQLSEGLSGRSLRKLPFMAHSLYTEQPQVTLGEFLVALRKAVESEQSRRSDMNQG